jgi:hypothetical protein
MVRKLIKTIILGPTEKVDGSRFFGPNFVKKCRKWVYRDLSKIRPHKKHCAWGSPPRDWNLWNLSIFYDFYRFWAFNTAGKTVTKDGIYALPPLGGPQKVIFFEKSRFLMIYANGFLSYRVNGFRQIYRDPILTLTVFLK